MHSHRTQPILLSTVLFSVFWLWSSSAVAQRVYEVKPRILFVFDTSGSMAWLMGGADWSYNYGDGSNDPWPNTDGNSSTTENCCFGNNATNGDGTHSRLYAAKNAMVQMLNASGEIEFALLKFSQRYQTYQADAYTSGQYYGNQRPSQWDKIRYQGLNNFTDWRRYLAVGFGDYNPGYDPLTYVLSDWRDVNTENDRAEVVSWLNHHEYGVDTGGLATGDADGSIYPGPYYDYKEQEIRADGSTPLGEALNASLNYTNMLRDTGTGLDRFGACRKYTVVVLTDGDWNGSINPVTPITALKSAGIDTWVIGLSYSSSQLNSMAAAGGGHYDPQNWGTAFTAYSQEALSAALFYIVSDSLVFEDCNYQDDDCDGFVDEGVAGEFCDIHDVLGTKNDTDTGWVGVVVEYDTDSSTDTDTAYLYNPNWPQVCDDPGETICDGLDDNCNGDIDELPADSDWSANEDSDFGQDCVPDDAPQYLKDQLTNSGTILAPCEPGTWICVSGGGGKTCTNYVGPNPERCDNKDNDCDGLIDEASEVDTDNYGLEGETCGNSLGICTPGVYTCVNGSGWQCVGGTVGTDETCNGLDDNCNGEVDELYPEAGDACYTAGDGGCDANGQNCKGICQAGISSCESGSIVCSGEVSAASDDSVCNGLNDDCDAEVDEDVVEGAICPSGATGWAIGAPSTCNRGTLQCLGSSGMVCVGDGSQPIAGPGVEVCDGLDNNCNGAVDENLYGPCGGCVDDPDCIDTDPGAGECRVGVGECDATLSTPGHPVYKNCNDQGPVTETCNGKDDDCDGEIDEASDLTEATLGDICYPSGLSGCESPDPVTGGNCTGQCSLGVIACVNGALACDNYVAPVAEGSVCDNLDNNCNGQIDEGVTHACGEIDTAKFPGASMDLGECEYGIQYCSPDTDNEDPATWADCEGARGPQEELCNGLDDDCDGLYENLEQDDLASNVTNSLVGESCGSCGGVYECERDTSVALDKVGGYKLICAGGEAEPEVCNGLDENCNQVADDGIAPEACGGCEWGVDTDWDCINGQPNAGECEVGYDYCIGGAWTTECYGSVKPSVEICDGLDNDCDGLPDEDFEKEVVCQEAVGECPMGIFRCTELDGELGLHCCDAKTWTTLGICEVPTVSQLEICDGLDNDCDGQKDEEIATVGQSCGSTLGECEPGVYQCKQTGNESAPAVNGYEVVCVGGTSGSTEVCNGLDDDCDGMVDEGIPVGDECTKAPNWMSSPDLQGAYPDGIGECPIGNYECVAGDWVCNVPGPTEEVCDGHDNDCDGDVDEGTEGADIECPVEGAICIEGTCSEPCGSGEFECPAGKACIDTGDGNKVCMTTLCDISRPDALPCVFNEGYCTPDQGFEAPCICDPIARMCVDACYNKTCPADSVCVATDGGRCHKVEEGCMAAGCPDGEKCVPIDVCDSGDCQQCVADPCAQVTCEEGQYCNESGVCVETCANVICPSGQGCKDGACTADDPCAGVICSIGVLCNPTTGTCDTTLKNPCQNISCEFYENCENGDCVFDVCMNIDCPNGTICKDGSCYAPGGFVADNGNTDTDENDGTDDLDTSDTETVSQDSSSDDNGVDEEPRTDYEGLDRVLASGTGGCTCSTAPGAQETGGAPWLLFLLGAGVFLFRAQGSNRKGKVNRYLPFIGLLLLTWSVAGCKVEPFEFEGADNPGDTATGIGRDTSSGSNGTGTDSRSDAEATDSDSDAFGDGTDDSDSSTDSADAGCASCDADQTCCTNTIGVEFCADLSSNPSHCGACNQVCSKPHATATCVASVCTMLACENYWHDINSSDADGCEYYCKPTADQDDNADVCDGAASSADPDNDDYVPQDNDCDFEYDEDVDFLTDPNNCGYCGNVCLFNHAAGQCVDGVCTMGACDDRWYDRANGSADGCEYFCDGSPGDAEVCDFQDNDCDGEIDESDPSEGAPCYPEGSSGCTAPFGQTDCKGICKAGVLSCQDGAMRCSGYVLPTLELCDGVDNNCNGLTDENLSIACGGAPGDNPEEGICQTGLAPCISAALGVSEAVYDTDTGCIGSVSPGAERCDGQDNDCDGLTDEFSTDDGNGNNIDNKDARLGQACGLGECAQYLTQCVDGAVFCEDYTPPAADIPCNKLDDDCDGLTDEIDNYLCGGSHGFPCNDTDTESDSDGLCDDYGEGVCLAGTFRCVDTDPVMVCDNDVGPSVADTDHLDLCDNLDNDCDGLVDEDAFYWDTETDRSCGPPCNDGQLACVNGTITCSGQTQPTPDLCDTASADEDCNPLTINGEGEANYLQSCDGTDADECEEGYWECGPSGMFCNEPAGDDIEVCDGVDNDCDGLIDYADSDMVVDTDMVCDNCPGTVQVVCAGSAGWQCKYDAVAGVDCGNDTDCYSHASIELACDGIDNDCDGVADDDYQLNNSVENCGACGHDCADLIPDTAGPDTDTLHVAEYYCSSGTCKVKRCAGTDTYFNVNSIDSDGCECQINPICETDTACDKCSGGSIIDVDDDCDGIADENAGAEICNNIDDDCDGVIDENLSDPAYCEALCDPTLSTDAYCDAGSWVCDYACGPDALECDTSGAPNPDITEAVCDGIDGNCDGSIDEGFGLGGSCSNSALSPVGGCLRYGKTKCASDGGTVCCDPSDTDVICATANIINMTDAYAHALPKENPVPDGVDDDCDGIVDEEANGAVEYVTVPYSNGSATLYFDIFRYEASRGNASVSSAGTVSTAACSQPYAMPWTYVNYAEAQAACDLLNTQTCDNEVTGCWELCSVPQWVHACEMANGDPATAYPYGDTYDPYTCNGLDYGMADAEPDTADTDPDTGTDSLYGVGARPSAYMAYCSADWPAINPASAYVMDMSGNVEEWTGTANTLGTGITLYGIRGGSFNDLASGLRCDFDFSGADGSSSSYRLENLGFRCCRMDLRCDATVDCPEYHWCDTDNGQCVEANQDDHCGSDLTVCASGERCAGSIEGCQPCTSDAFCGASCVACAAGKHCNDTSCI